MMQETKIKIFKMVRWLRLSHPYLQRWWRQTLIQAVCKIILFLVQRERQYFYSKGKQNLILTKSQEG